ncbi:MAG: Gfo/Idh/MocA family oxidoreductase [Verrucomicrobiota bacterium]|nr:Gfo/Idh/MocA family oxidoreductase [Verrucomicrobiota bacterium]
MIYKVGILGAGRIAQGFDEPDSEVVLTMVHAFKKSGRFQVAGFFDIDPQKANLAETKWNVPASSRDRASWMKSGWDAVYIATPDMCHESDFSAVLKEKVRGVLLEKPVSTDATHGVEMIKSARAANIPVLVNYPRRLHSAVRKLKVDAPKLGKIVHASFLYSGGALHNGVHMFDAFMSIWGGDWTMRNLSSGTKCSVLELKRADMAFEATFTDIPQDHYYVWEMRVLCENGAVVFAGNPEEIHVFEKAADPIYTTFTVLKEDWRSSMENESLLERVVLRFAEVLDSSDAALKQLDQELAVQKFVEQLNAHLNFKEQ